MRHKFPLLILNIMLVSSLCGCGAKKASISAYRDHPTGISQGEAVVILLNESTEHDLNVESEHKESDVEDCMVDAIKRDNPRLKVVSATDFRKAIFPGKKFKDVPRSPESLLLFLQDEKSRQQVQMIGVRYLIIVDTNTSNSTGELIFDELYDEGGGMEFWVLGNVSTRTSSYLAYVIDVRQSAESGRLSASSAGKVGFAVPFFYYIIPLPPVPFFARTEAKACDGLGSAVASFIWIEREESKTK